MRLSRKNSQTIIVTSIEKARVKEGKEDETKQGSAGYGLVMKGFWSLSQLVRFCHYGLANDNPNRRILSLIQEKG
jgi:hypothetical protein